MAGRLAVDFGTSNTVLATWDLARQHGQAFHVPDYGHLVRQLDEQVSIIPSLVHYAAPDRLWIGQQVVERGLYTSNQTFRWMKRYIMQRSPVRRRLHGLEISPAQAASDFLERVLLFAGQALELSPEDEIVLTAPVEAFEDYSNWLAAAAAGARLPRFRLIDEPSAAALGYGAHIQPGDVYLIFDFGGGTLDVAVVLIEPNSGDALLDRRCRVLGKAGSEFGGISIDQWLFRAALQRGSPGGPRSDSDEDVRPLSSALLAACEELKEALSFADQASLSGEAVERLGLEYSLTRSQFEDLLDEHDALNNIERTARRAMHMAAERGYGEGDIKAVLLVGGSSQIPAVQRTLRRMFGKERVLLNRPLDAIARGAAAFAAGVDFFDHIQHDYAIRHLNRATGEYDYRMLVRRGTEYPTSQPLARLTVKATYAGQTQLGVDIFELSAERATAAGGAMELVFDPSGAARLVALSPQEREERQRFWMNERARTFLLAEPPAQAGEACFDVQFFIDAHKRLTLTARDARSGQVVLQDHPVINLV